MWATLIKVTIALFTYSLYWALRQITTPSSQPSLVHHKIHIYSNQLTNERAESRAEERARVSDDGTGIVLCSKDGCPGKQFPEPPSLERLIQPTYCAYDAHLLPETAYQIMHALISIGAAWSRIVHIVRVVTLAISLEYTALLQQHTA